MMGWISKALKARTTFVGLSEEQKKARARWGVALAVILFMVMNVLAFAL